MANNQTSSWLPTLQFIGGAVATAAFLTNPVLSFFGLSAVGPIAGSVAAGWQASLGLVPAGSLFAGAQSLAMGGAASAAVAGTGITAAVVGVGATVGRMVGVYNGEAGGAEKINGGEGEEMKEANEEEAGQELPGETSAVGLLERMGIRLETARS